MIISAKVILKPRSVKRCSFCNDLMSSNKPRLRIKGYADKGDPLQTEYQHLECATRGIMSLKEAKKIAQALEKYNKSLNLTSRPEDGLSSS